MKTELESQIMSISACGKFVHWENTITLLALCIMCTLTLRSDLEIKRCTAVVSGSVAVISLSCFTCGLCQNCVKYKNM